MIDTISLSIEYCGDFWWHPYYKNGIVYRYRMNTFSLFIDSSEEKTDIQKKKRVVLKKKKDVVLKKGKRNITDRP